MSRPRASHALVAAFIAAVTALVGLTVPISATAATGTEPAPVTTPSTSVPPTMWTVATGLPARRGPEGERRRVAPRDFAAYHLDLEGLTDQLAAAPRSGRERSSQPSVTVAVPTPTGHLVEFEVVETSVMEPGLAAAHPEIRTWAGRATSGSAASIRLDVTPMGFHASVRGDGAAWFVDPAFNGPGQGGDALYLSYRGDDLPANDAPLAETVVPRSDLARRVTSPGIGEGAGAAVVERTYRLAFLTDNTYAEYFAPGESDPAVVDSVVTSEKVTLVNRVDHLYGDDLAVRLVLVDRTDATNLNTVAAMYEPAGPCGPVACFTPSMVAAGCDSPLLDRNRFVLGQIVGADAYDVGHIGLGLNGGGLAGLGVVGSATKAAGCTGLPTPDGDFYAIDYVAHELGHQFGGNHTFDSAVCASNGNAATAVEPGSGSSVMAYAGICGSDDLQPHTDPYFSQRTQSEIGAFVTASRPAVREVQNIGLTGFGTGETLRISFPGGTATSLAFAAYTAAGIKSALEAAEPGSATAAVVGYAGSSSLTSGFQATWSSTGAIATPTVTVTTGAADVMVGTTDNGGAATNGGAVQVTSANRNPVVTAPPARVVPARTPFELAGSATDPDGDPLVYTWEQNDAGNLLGSALNSNVKLAGPLFRVFGTYADVTEAGALEYSSPGQNAAPSTPVRSFPDAAQVAAGHTNAATGLCPTSGGSTAMPPGAALDCYSEFLPTAVRTMTFRLTARDLGGADGGFDGGVAYADTTLTVSPLGPFLVTSQNTATTVVGGADGSVTWTPDLLSLAGNVKITLSTDGGLTYPTVVAASTANDGSHAVQWPNLPTTKGRIKVQAVDNYFYDLNDADLTITPGTDVPSLLLEGNADGATFTAASSDALTTTPSVTATAGAVDGNALVATASGLPTGLSISTSQVTAPGVRPASARFDVVGVADTDPGTYPVTLSVDDGPGGASAQQVSFTVNVTRDLAVVSYTGATSAVALTGGQDAVDVTLSASVADTDATPGVVTGTVAFTDRLTGEALCGAPVSSQTATCSFGADLSGNDDRIYEVIATLTSPRYTGASAAQVVVVERDPGLMVTWPADPSTQYSDPVSVSVTVSTRYGEGTSVSMSSVLPDGLTLTRTATSDTGIRPGLATFTLAGGEDLAPGSHELSMTVEDGVHASVQRTLTLTVERETAALAYTGPTTVSAGASDPSVAFTLQARITSSPDGSTGDVSRATVAFTDVATGETLCAAAPVLAESGGDVGYATCAVTAALTGTGRTYRLRLDAGGWFTGTAAPTVVTVTQPAPPDTTAPDTTITSGPVPNSFVTAASVRMVWSSEPGVTYTCSLVGYVGPIACPVAGSTTWSKLPGGSYEFRVAATDAAGNLDLTPATRRFHVPFDDRLLKKGSGTWKKKTSSTAFRGTYQTIAKKGGSLTYKVAGALSIAVVVEKGPKYGTLDVFLGSKKLKTIKTAASKVTPMVITVVTTGTKPLTGTLKLVSTSNAQVRVDAVGVTKAIKAG